MRMNWCFRRPHLSLAALWTLSGGDWSFAFASVPVAPVTDKSLRNGRSVPTLGLQVPEEGPHTTIAWATSFGYRMLDIEGNESSAGQAIRGSSVSRSRLFLSARLPENGFQAAHRGIRQSLQLLRVDYVDLYMMASPKKLVETWDAMVEMRKMGLARSLGVCDFELLHMETLKSHGRELPEVLQLKMSPFTWHQHRALLDWCQRHGVLIQAARVFALPAQEAFQQLRSLPALKDHRAKSAAQVLLRWAIQMGFQVISRSRRKDHIVENADVWSFNLSTEEMQIISALGHGSEQGGGGGRENPSAHASLDLGDTTLGNRSRELSPATEL